MTTVLVDTIDVQGLSASPAHLISSRAQQKPIAVTVKLDVARYEMLKIHGMRTRKSNQDILVDALDRFLR